MRYPRWVVCIDDFLYSQKVKWISMALNQSPSQRASQATLHDASPHPSSKEKTPLIIKEETLRSKAEIKALLPYLSVGLGAPW